MSKIRISLLEFDYHIEVLRNSMHILDCTSFEVNIFTSNKIWRGVGITLDQLSIQTHLYTYDPKKISLKHFLRQHEAVIESSDVLLFNTVASNYKQLESIIGNVPAILRIHNSNAYFNSLRNSYRPKFTLFYLWKDISHFIRIFLFKLEAYRRKKFLNKVEFYSFPGKKIREFAIENFGLSQKKALFLPFSFWKTDGLPGSKTEHGVIKFTIIGKVDRRNRDYGTVIQAFKLLLKDESLNPFRLELVLLGNAGSRYGRAVVRALEEIFKDRFLITSYKRYVSQDEFESQISNTDIFILPLNTETRYTIYREYYGRTKISGAVNDVIKYHKPALINKTYPLDDDIKSCFKQYVDAKDLADKIKQSILQGANDQFNFHDVLANYEIDKIRALYKREITEVLKHR